MPLFLTINHTNNALILIQLNFHKSIAMFPKKPFVEPFGTFLGAVADHKTRMYLAVSASNLGQKNWLSCADLSERFKASTASKLSLESSV
jgi:hypothetical protein